MPDDGKAKNDDFVKDVVAKYKVGDVNYAGNGDWEEAEIYSAYSNSYYSVVFDDCTQEIATFDERMRPHKAILKPRKLKMMLANNKSFILRTTPESYESSRRWRVIEPFALLLIYSVRICNSK